MPSPKARKSSKASPVGGVAAGGPAGGVAGGESAVGGGELSSLVFAAVARELGEAGRRRGIEPPAFRSPPRAPGLRRSIRRERDGSATVSVALRGRPAMAVVADMVEGMIAAAGMVGVEAGAARDELWMAALGVLFEAQAPGPAVVPERRAA